MIKLDARELAERTKIVQPFQMGEKKNEMASLLKQLEDRRRCY
jgi:hypothetical protein